MQDHPEPADTGSRRVLVAIAIALAAATVSAGVVLGHRPEAGRPARLTAAGVVPATTAVERGATPARDPSLPSAADALEHAPAGADEPAPTF